MEEQEVRICAICGAVIEDGESFAEVDEDIVCHDCLENNSKYFYCEDCDTWFSSESVSSYETKAGTTVCESCAEHYRFCGNCEELFSDDEGAYVDMEWVCDDCLEESGNYFYCEDCGTWFSYRNSNYYEVAGDRYVCENCYDEYETCCECSRSFRRDDMDFIEDSDEYICGRCNRDRRKNPIKNYSYKPTPKYKTMAHDEFLTSNSIKELLFGLELEVDSGDNPEKMATELVELSEDVYCKHDGSLGRNGVEIVTHPCSLEYHIKEFGWDKVIAIARKYNYLGHDSGRCGLHIHVGRDQLGKNYREQDDVAANIIVLMNKHWEKLVKFSRRRSGQLGQWASKPYVDLTEKPTAIVRNALNTSNNGRYQALNLENSSTIEFRLFNSTLKLETLLATIKLVDNFCKYSMSHTVEDCIESNWLDIALYEEDKTLRDYLELRKILENDKPEEVVLEPTTELCGELPLIDDKEDEEDEIYPVGTRVVVVSANVRAGHQDDVGALRNLIGQEATVVISDFYRDHRYGLEFNNYNGELHSLNGQCHGGHGYYVHPENIRRARTVENNEADTYTEYAPQPIRTIDIF